MKAIKTLPPVYPSDKITIGVVNDDFDGAYEYQFVNCLGFESGETQYDPAQIQRINFVRKREDGTMIPGLQSEQLLIALIDRHKKLNAKYPSREGALAITKMEEALHWLEARVRERIDRGVMGKLEK